MRIVFLIGAIGWAGLWFTPDQQGQRLYSRGEYGAAAEAFEDPLWKGMAWYRAGEFEKAAGQFARRDTPEAHFNRGNALVMRGEYESAVAAYERTLVLRPEWREAEENRDLALARAKLLEQKGGEMGDQKIGADEIRFDKPKEASGEDTEMRAEQASSNKDVQALWLRRVQTNPGDFLRAKFSYQQTNRDREEAR